MVRVPLGDSGLSITVAAALAIAVGLLAPAVASAGTVRGQVYVDKNGDGVPSASEKGVAGAVVAFETGVFTRTDASGRFELTAPGSGFVWVRVPDGFVPGPVYAKVPIGGDSDVDLGLTPLSSEEAAAPLTFVVASDSHLSPGDKAWGRAEFAAAVEQAVALDPPPRFFTIVGDVTQANQPQDFADVDAVLGDLAVPWIPVAGNHDWYDGGGAWRDRYGPDSFSFDIQSVHFVVWNAQTSDQDSQAFLEKELALVDPAMTVVVLGHAAPPTAVIATMRELGVDYLLTGHWHANRVVDHGGGLLELNTQTFVMGGIDFTPAGYRVITIEDGTLAAYHRTVVDAPQLALVSPAGVCVAPDGAEVIASAEVDASRLEVTAAIDCGPEIPLASAGGWAYRGRLGALGPGPHTLTLRARGVADTVRVDTAIEVCAPAAAVAREAGEWPQLQGGPDHRGHQVRPIPPPLEVAWTTTVGGHIHQGAPVVSGGLVYVAASDLGGGDQGGVVALELATGAERWRHVTKRSVRAAPAVGGGVVVVGLVDGEVHGLDAATGAPIWTYQVSEGLDSRVGALFAAPTIADGTVYVGVQRHFAALDLATGVERWSVDPTPRGTWHGSFVAPTVSGGLVLGQFDRDLGGVVAYDEAEGAGQGDVWRLLGAPSVAMGGSPLSDGVTVFVANGQAEVGAFDLGTGAPKWSRVLDPQGWDWGYSTSATPALADGRLFVAIQYRDLVALDAEMGDELWRFAAAGSSVVHPTHYRGAGMAGFQGSPLVAGSTVWIGGTDGRLSALDAATGVEQWHLDVGAPILSGLAAAGDYLVVPSWDGVVRALVPAVAPPVMPVAPVVCPADPEPVEDGGCCGAGRGRAGDAVLLAVALVAMLRRRR
jgi:outer membrane protein assembly factor BamB/predicted phosphodiesterase